MSPTNDDAVIQMLAAVREDVRAFREEWKRDLADLVTKAVFESEMHRRDDQIAGVRQALATEAMARETFAKGLAAERAERRATVKWVAGLLGAPVVGLVINQVIQSVGA